MQAPEYLNCNTAVSLFSFYLSSLYRFNHSCHFTSLPFWSFLMSSFPTSVHSLVTHKSPLPPSVLLSLIHSLPFFFHSILNNTSIFPSIEPRLGSIHLDLWSWSSFHSGSLLKVILMHWIHIYFQCILHLVYKLAKERKSITIMIAFCNWFWLRKITLIYLCQKHK